MTSYVCASVVPSRFVEQMLLADKQSIFAIILRSFSPVATHHALGGNIDTALSSPSIGSAISPRGTVCRRDYFRNILYIVYE